MKPLNVRFRQRSSRPPAVPVVESIKQLTDDGSRVYFTEGTTGSGRLAQVSVTGGQTAFIDDHAADTWLQGISPDGSTLLAFLNMASRLEAPVWSIPIPAGEPRQLGDMAVLVRPISQTADFC